MENFYSGISQWTSSEASLWDAFLVSLNCQSGLIVVYLTWVLKDLGSVWKFKQASKFDICYFLAKHTSFSSNSKKPVLFESE